MRYPDDGVSVVVLLPMRSASQGKNRWFGASSVVYHKRQKAVSGPGTIRAKAFADLGELLESLRKQHKKVFLLLGNPMSEGFDPHTHIARLTEFKPLRADSYVTLDTEQERLRRSLLQLAAKTRADVVDPFPALCDSDKCRWLSDDGVPIYKDDSHFNPAWGLAHAGFIDKTIQPVRVGSVAKAGP